MIRSRALQFLLSFCFVVVAAAAPAPAPTGFVIEGAQLGSLIADFEMWFPQRVEIERIVNFGDGDGNPDEVSNDLLLQVWATNPATPAVPARKIWQWWFAPLPEGYEYSGLDYLGMELPALFFLTEEVAWNLELRLYEAPDLDTPVATATLADYDAPVNLATSEAGEDLITVARDMGARIYAERTSFFLNRATGTIRLTLSDLRNITGSETIGPVVATLFAVTGVTDDWKLQGYVLGRGQVRTGDPDETVTLAPGQTVATASVTTNFRDPPPDGYPVAMILSEAGAVNMALGVQIYESTFLEPQPQSEDNDNDDDWPAGSGDTVTTTTYSSSSGGGSVGVLALLSLLVAGGRRRRRLPR